MSGSILEGKLQVCLMCLVGPYYPLAMPCKPPIHVTGYLPTAMQNFLISILVSVLEANKSLI
jgi:hypothetical protein